MCSFLSTNSVYNPGKNVRALGRQDLAFLLLLGKHLLFLITEVHVHFLTLLYPSVCSSLASEARNVSKYLQLYITRVHMAVFCYMEVGCMENYCGSPSEQQSIYSLQNGYSLMAEAYLQSVAAKGFNPENPEGLLLKPEYYKVGNV